MRPANILRPVFALAAAALLLAPVPAQSQGLLDQVIGAWCLRDMHVPIFYDTEFEGYMNLDPPGDDPTRTTGELYVVTLDDGSFGRQRLDVRAFDGGRITAQGTLLEYQNWIEDTLSMELDGADRLVGTGVDPNGTTFSYIFERGACSNATS